MHHIDPDFLPEITGQVDCFILNPKGDLDGLVLDGDRLVHFPPHLSARVAALVQPGDTLRVHGVRPRGAGMVAAIRLITADGQTIVDDGPEAGKAERHSGKHAESEPLRGPATVKGSVRLSLFAPNGELRGALLDDGTALRLPPHEVERVARYLQPGVTIRASGEAVESTYGRTVEVREIGGRSGELHVVEKNPEHDKKHGHQKKPEKHHDKKGAKIDKHTAAI